MSLFITLEGPDGSGKSTQAARLSQRLRDAGYDVLHTREPGGTPISQQVRQVLMDLKNEAMSAETEFLLFSAARAQHVHQALRPQLERGGIVVCDRFYDSSFAYQGYGHGLPLDTIRAVTALATGGLRPDLTLLFDISPEAGLRRRQQGHQEWTRLDAMALAFHTRVRAGFHALAAAEPDRFVTIDADRPADAVAADVWAAVAGRLP